MILLSSRLLTSNLQEGRCVGRRLCPLALLAIPLLRSLVIVCAELLGEVTIPTLFYAKKTEKSEVCLRLRFSTLSNIPAKH
jgi:hypothetical protein